MSDSIAVGVLPYGKSLGRAASALSLDEVIWPLGRPDRLRDGTLADLERQDHLIVYPKTAMHFQLWRGTRARISLLMCEPSIIHARHIALLNATYWRFFRVLSFNETLVARLPNAIFFPFGTTWVPNWREIGKEKTAMISLVASEKRDSEGHKLRHAIAAWTEKNDRVDVALMGRGYQPFEAKSDGLAPYRYSVVIENVRETNYFSEKLVDAVLCDTVPIYWGCPNLDDFVDTTGIIECRSEADLRQAIERASPAEYEKKLPYIKLIQDKMATFTGIEARAVEVIRDAISKHA